MLVMRAQINIATKARRTPLRSVVLALVVASAWGGALFAQDVTITNVTAANVTPSGFSVVFLTVDPATPGLAIYSDATGTNSLAGQLGIEPLPLRAGSTVLVEEDERRQFDRELRTKTLSHGLGQVRVTGCQPNTTYYYRVLATDTTGQTVVWPAGGPLPSVTTAVETVFVPDARQLIVDLPGPGVEGQLITLSHPSATYPLAAVVGDGAGTNQALFSLSDLMTQAGGTNFIPVGSQQFEVHLVGQESDANFYTLNFTTAFAVVSTTNVTYTAGAAEGVLALSLGSSALLAGDAGEVPISLFSSAGLRSVGFSLDVPAGRLANLTVQPLLPVLQSATIQQISPTRWQVLLTAQAGQTLTGTQQVARIQFSAVAGQTSAFVPLQITAMDGRNGADGVFLQQFGESGRLVIIGARPLLEARFGALGREDLILYGRPGSTYQIQIANNLGNDSWIAWRSVTLGGIAEVFADVNPALSIAFFRAFEVTGLRFEVRLGLDGKPELWLHGRAGTSILVEVASTLTGGGDWSTWARVPLINSPQQVPGSLLPGTYYRAREFVADPPVLEARLAATGQRSLVVYGQPGVFYQLEYTTNLTGVVTWQQQLSTTLIDSFEILSGLPSADPLLIYRVVDP